MLTLLIAFSLALIPFACVTGWGDGIRTPKEILSVIFMVAIILTSFRFYRIEPFKNKWLLLFGGWCFLTLILSNYSINVYLDKGNMLIFPSNMIAFKSLLYIILAIATIICLSGARRSRGGRYRLLNFELQYNETHTAFDIKFLSKVISYVALFISVFAILQIFGIDEWFRVADPGTGWVGRSIWDKTAPIFQFGSLEHRVVATIGNPALLGIFLAIIAVFPLSLKSVFGYSVFILSTIIIIITHSTTAYVAFLTSTLFYILFTNRKLFIVLALLLLLFIPFSHNKINYHFKFMLNPTGRFDVLRESWQELYKKPITGLGLGSFEYMIGTNPEHVKNLNNQNWKEMHNEYGQIFFETGIVGLILFLMFVFTSLLRFGNPILGASLVAFSVACITYFPMRVAPLSFYGVIITGLALNKNHDQ